MKLKEIGTMLKDDEIGVMLKPRKTIAETRIAFILIVYRNMFGGSLLDDLNQLKKDMNKEGK